MGRSLQFVAAESILLPNDLHGQPVMEAPARRDGHGAPPFERQLLPGRRRAGRRRRSGWFPSRRKRSSLARNSGTGRDLLGCAGAPHRDQAGHDGVGRVQIDASSRRRVPPSLHRPSAFAPTPGTARCTGSPARAWSTAIGRGQPDQCRPSTRRKRRSMVTTRRRRPRTRARSSHRLDRDRRDRRSSQAHRSGDVHVQVRSHSSSVTDAAAPRTRPGVGHHDVQPSEGLGRRPLTAAVGMAGVGAVARRTPDPPSRPRPQAMVPVVSR